jgi:tRNA A37 methylthiotransferase MiaB
VIVGDIFAHTELLAAPVFEAANERTRPNLKVQDGCDNRCSFCVIPYVRGQSRSLPRERVIAEVRTLVEAGYREVVISGINLGRWGRGSGFVWSSQNPNPSRRRFNLRCLSCQLSVSERLANRATNDDWSI